MLRHIGSLLPYRKSTSVRLDRERSLAQAIVDTVREPLLVFDKDLRVVAASRSFYLTFRADRQETHGRLLCEIGDGQWNIPGLRAQLEKIAPDDAVLEDYEVEHAFPEIGHRIMLLNARKVFYEDNGHTTLLLAIDDVTERRAADRVLQQLLRQKELLLAEMQHRVANSLQIIASILLLKASTVQSEETRLHLHDAHKRVISVAAAQQHLLASPRGDPIAIGPYLSKLCETLAQSMIGDGRRVALAVVQQREVVERAADLEMVGAKGFFLDRKGASEQRLSLGIATLGVVQQRQVVERAADLGVVGAKGSFFDRQSADEERLGLRVAALGTIQLGEPTHTCCGVRMVRALLG
jgi:hypothetical protein